MCRLGLHIMWFLVWFIMWQWCFVVSNSIPIHACTCFKIKSKPLLQLILTIAIVMAWLVACGSKQSFQETVEPHGPMHPPQHHKASASDCHHFHLRPCFLKKPRNKGIIPSYGAQLCMHVDELIQRAILYCTGLERPASLCQIQHSIGETGASP